MALANKRFSDDEDDESPDSLDSPPNPLPLYQKREDDYH